MLLLLVAGSMWCEENEGGVSGGVSSGWERLRRMACLLLRLCRNRSRSGLGRWWCQEYDGLPGLREKAVLRHPVEALRGPSSMLGWRKAGQGGPDIDWRRR
jgi:hypothetical protein